MSRLPIAILGAGIFARDAHLPVLQAMAERYEVVAVCSRSAENRAKFLAALGQPAREYETQEALLADGDIAAVDVCVPINALPSAVSACLKAGKHVISEKPLAPSVAQGRALLAEVRGHTGAWMVAENWRTAPALKHAQRLLQQGLIGQPALFHWAIHTGMNANVKYYHTAWRRDNTYQGGFLLDGGVHFAAGLRLLLGEVAQVQAFSALQRPDLPPLDTISAALRMQSGLLGTFAVTFAVAFPWTTSLTIAGTEGALEVHRNAVKVTRLDGTLVEQTLFEGDGGVTEEFRAFADVVQNGAPNPNPPEEAFHDLALIEALIQAAETGRPHSPQPLEP
jgi:predicted dehydrogenase